MRACCRSCYRIDSQDRAADQVACTVLPPGFSCNCPRHLRVFVLKPFQATFVIAHALPGHPHTLLGFSHN